MFLVCSDYRDIMKPKIPLRSIVAGFFYAFANDMRGSSQPYNKSVAILIHTNNTAVKRIDPIAMGISKLLSAVIVTNPRPL